MPNGRTPVRRRTASQLFGDLPFMVDGDSADVWARQDQFRFDASVGVPPDAFSATGQDWGMPVYRWDVIAARGFPMAARARAAQRRSVRRLPRRSPRRLLSHLRPASRRRRAVLHAGATSGEQEALGERVLGILRGAGAEIIAEDLGTVPDFVRASLARLGVPGFRVFRWERHWHAEGQPFRDPSDYPPMSVAASGTHDTEPLVVWWAARARGRAREGQCDRRRFNGSPTERVSSAADEPTVRDVILETLFASGSNLLLLPVQDVFGWRDRINQPATVTDDNWTFRLPWPSDRLDEVAEARERQGALLRPR